MQMSYTKPVIANFTSAKYKPCKGDITPIFETLAAQNKQAEFVEVDIQTKQNIILDQNIHCLQTFKIYKHSICIDEVTDQNEGHLRLMIDINTNYGLIYTYPSDPCTDITHIFDKYNIQYKIIYVNRLDKPTRTQLSDTFGNMYPKLFIDGKSVL